MSTAWLVTGARGQLGQDLLAVLAGRTGDEVTAVGRSEVDLTDEESVRSAVRSWLGAVEADRAVLLNAAAYTAVDAAEGDEATALAVNGHAPGWLAEEMAGRGRLLHVSTDYVFGGSATQPYPVDAPIDPGSAYGRTKAAGERAVASVDGDAVVVRTAWVYGRHGRNFVRTMTDLEAQRETITVVDDQVGSPTWSAHLSAGLVALGETAEQVPSVLHYTNDGQTSWHGLARAVFEELGADPARVLPTTSADFVRPAPRPAFSVLDGSVWDECGLPVRRDWRAALSEAMAVGFRDLPRGTVGG